MQCREKARNSKKNAWNTVEKHFGKIQWISGQVHYMHTNAEAYTARKMTWWDAVAEDVRIYSYNCVALRILSTASFGSWTKISGNFSVRLETYRLPRGEGQRSSWGGAGSRPPRGTKQTARQCTPAPISNLGRKKPIRRSRGKVRPIKCQDGRQKSTKKYSAVGKNPPPK